MRPERLCYVFIQLADTLETVPCASLQVQNLGAGTWAGTFTYGRRYLARRNVVALDTFHLPLTPQPLRFTQLKGIPGAVRDASADAWGRRVIQAKLHRAEADIGEIDYLLNGPDDGAGNLSFGRSPDLTPTQRPFNRTHQLNALLDAANMIEDDIRLPHEVLQQLEPGTSMGGARPKVTLEHEQALWLAKLPERQDRHNMQRVEFATLQLAAAAGVSVCVARLQPIGAQEALMLNRFDRVWDEATQRYRRLALVSGLTVLNAEDGYVGRERWSYPLLADELRRWSSHVNEDRVELFRRMVFNAMVTNNDDHPRNHALLRASTGWRLSPAYDIVPVPMIAQERRDLALTVGRLGRSAARYNLISQCDAFGLTTSEAHHIIDHMLDVVRQWRSIFANHGVEPRTIEMLERAMLPPSFLRETPPEGI